MVRSVDDNHAAELLAAARPSICIRLAGITKRFAGVTALSDVSLDIAEGHVHALMGENGAGKSTLGKVIAGIHRADEGRMELDGQLAAFAHPRDALRQGVGMVHQELSFCPDMTVAENLCLAQLPRRLGVLLNRRALRDTARGRLAEIGVQLDVEAPMRSLSTAQEQQVQIAAAVGAGARVLIFDEPTSSLSITESQRLFSLIDRLRDRRVTMIYVSHRLPEVMSLSDRISVLRDGRLVGTLDRGSATESQVVEMMIGRSLEAYFPKHLSTKPGDVRLRVRGLSSPCGFRDVSFEVRAGEIVGMAGLVGSGRSEIASAIFGLDRQATCRGEGAGVWMDGQRMRLGNVRRAMRRGIGLTPEDRKRQGLVLMMSCRANLSMTMLGRLKRCGVLLNHGAEATLVREYFRKLDVRASSIETPVVTLSGGNQQKIVLAKWLARQCKLLIVDEPTRGVDVGSKAAIHALIDQLAAEGAAVLLISSELPEVMNLATRTLVMREGQLVGEASRDAATQSNLLSMMAGVEQTEPRTK